MAFEITVHAETGNMPTDLGISEERVDFLGERVGEIMDGTGGYPAQIIQKIAAECNSLDELVYIIFGLGVYYESIAPADSLPRFTNRSY